MAKFSLRMPSLPCKCWVHLPNATPALQVLSLPDECWICLNDVFDSPTLNAYSLALSTYSLTLSTCSLTLGGANKLNQRHILGMHKNAESYSKPKSVCRMLRLTLQNAESTSRGEQQSFWFRRLEIESNGLLEFYRICAFDFTLKIDYNLELYLTLDLTLDLRLNRKFDIHLEIRFEYEFAMPFWNAAQWALKIKWALYNEWVNT